MALNVIRGRRRVAVRAVVYGTEGVGKSTLAASFPDAVILDTEDGTNHLDVARIPCADWATLKAAVSQLGLEKHQFKTVVIDTADWAERSLVEDTLKKEGKRSIEDFGFGKGWVLVGERFSELLHGCDRLIGLGINVVFVAHSIVKRTTPPDQTDGWDRYELKCSKQVSALLREWCDLLLFATFETRLVAGKDGRTRATGGKNRVMFAERSAAFDAKNRFGLPEKIPMSIDALAAVFTPAEPQQAPRWLDRVRAATTVEQLDDLSDEADAAQSEGTLTDAQRKKLDAAIIRRHDEIETEDTGTEPFDAAEVQAEAHQ
jgi:hypothetical protein